MGDTVKENSSVFFLGEFAVHYSYFIITTKQFKYFTKNSVFVTRPLVKFKIDKKS